MIKAEILLKPVVYSVTVPSSLDAPLNNTILRDSTKNARFEEEIKCVVMGEQSLYHDIKSCVNIYFICLLILCEPVRV